MKLSLEDHRLLNAVIRNDADAAEAVQQAIQNGANVNAVRDHFSALFHACGRGNDPIIRILLDAGADARWRNRYGSSAVFKACYYEEVSTVQLLINHDKSLLEMADKYGGTPLVHAISFEYVDTVRCLLDIGADADCVDHNGKTALMHATESNLEIVRLLLAAGVDVEARDDEQQTALHHAVNNENIEVVRELILQHNANMFAEDKDGRTPFDLACLSMGRGAAISLLLEFHSNKLTQDHGQLALNELLKIAEYSFADEDEEFHPPLMNRLRIILPLIKLKLTLQHLRTLLHNLDRLDPALIHNRDDTGKLPIHVACLTNAPVEVLSLLVELDPTTLRIADSTGALPIHLLCGTTTANEYASVRYMVEQGGVGTLAARDRQGLLPLHVLCESTNPPLRALQYLIQSYSGSVAVQTNAGQYPFMMAAAADSSSASLSVIYELVRANPGSILITPEDRLFAALILNDADAAEAVQHAIRDGANVSAVRSGLTPLFHACVRGYDQLVGILLNAGADARWRNPDGSSAISLACYQGHCFTVQLLINHDKSLLEMTNHMECTPLFFAVLHQHSDIVRFLLDSGADPHHVHGHVVTALMIACRSGGLEIVRLLLAAGVDVEARDSAGQTALHHAADSGSIEVVRELILQQNANMFAVDSSGHTPFDLARIHWSTARIHWSTGDLECLLEIYGNRLTQDNGSLALHELLKIAEYSFAEDENFHPPLN